MRNTAKIDLKTVLDAVDHMTPQELEHLKDHIEQRLKLLTRVENIPDATQEFIPEGRLTRRHQRFCEG